MSHNDCNPQLKSWARIIPSTEPGQGRIEHPGEFGNRVWQTRERPAEPFELELVEALESVFESGAVELADVVAGLNKRQVVGGLSERQHMDRQGNPWTEESFLQEMAVLGH